MLSFCLFASLLILSHGARVERRSSEGWRIVGGTEAAAGSAPYVASLTDTFFGHFCGGVIISKNTVLTSAQCLEEADLPDTVVKVGTNSLQVGGDTIKASKFITHPDLDTDEFSNDVGLVILARPMTLSSLVATIPLQTTFVDGGVAATLSGWGYSVDADMTTKLQTLNLRTISLSQCRSSLTNINPILDSNICTFTKKGEGVCIGDYGSPLIAGGKVIGIASWGKPCAEGAPDVYVRVSSYSTWINSNTVA